MQAFAFDRPSSTLHRAALRPLPAARGLCRFAARLVAAAGLALTYLAAAAQAPALRPYQGQYFRVSVPAGWKVSETANGVDVVAPDGTTGTSFALLMGAIGQTTPRNFLTTILRGSAYADLRIEKFKDLPNQPGPMGMPWKVSEAELRFSSRGAPMQAYAVVAIAQGFNQYSAVMRISHAAPALWDKQRAILIAINDSVLITNPRQVAGADQVQLPRNRPLDETYGSYQRAAPVRQASSDRLSQQRHEATLGYRRMKDPQTGKLYNMPNSAYDGTVGGYRNPARPNEILIPAKPGE